MHRRPVGGGGCSFSLLLPQYVITPPTTGPACSSVVLVVFNSSGLNLA